MCYGVPLDERHRFLGNHAHTFTQNHTHTSSLSIVFKPLDFLAWVRTRYGHDCINQHTAYFKKHLANRAFNDPIELQTYIQAKGQGVKNLVSTARAYLNYSEQTALLSPELLTRYRAILKAKKPSPDYFVPANTDVLANYRAIKSHKSLEIVYLVLATSGIRYVECLEFLRHYEPEKFIVRQNYVIYSVSSQRNTKNINNIYLPRFVYDKLARVPNTYHGLRQRFKMRKTTFSLKYLRKWQYNFLLYQKVPESVADFIQGRVSKSVGANHYLAKGQQAEFWYAKVVSQLEALFHNKTISGNLRQISGRPSKSPRRQTQIIRRRKP